MKGSPQPPLLPLSSPPPTYHPASPSSPPSSPFSAPKPHALPSSAILTVPVSLVFNTKRLARALFAVPSNHDPHNPLDPELSLPGGEDPSIPIPSLRGFDTPSPITYTAEALWRWPIPEPVVKPSLPSYPPSKYSSSNSGTKLPLCEVHHDGAFLSTPVVQACGPAMRPRPINNGSATGSRESRPYLERLKEQKNKLIYGALPVSPPRRLLSFDDEATDVEAGLYVSNGKARIRAGSSRIDCVDLETSLPERLCRTRNVALRVDRLFQSAERLQLVPDSLHASCELDEDWWFSGKMFGVGAAGMMLESLNILEENKEDIQCDAYIDTPLYTVERWDTTNPYQNHQDLIHAFIAYNVFDIDVATVQPVFLDQKDADGPLATIWTRIFSESKPRVDINSLPFMEGLIQPAPLPRLADGRVPQVLCLREVVWSVHGGISALARGGRRPTACPTSDLFLAFRSFMLDRSRRAVLGPDVWWWGRDDEPSTPTSQLSNGTSLSMDLVSRTGAKTPVSSVLHDWTPPKFVHPASSSSEPSDLTLRVPLPVPKKHALPSEEALNNLVHSLVQRRIETGGMETAGDIAAFRKTFEPTLLAATAAASQPVAKAAAAESAGAATVNVAYPPTLTITYAIRGSAGSPFPLAGPLRDMGPPLSPATPLAPLDPISRQIDNQNDVIHALARAAREWTEAALPATSFGGAGNETQPAPAPPRPLPPRPAVEFRAVDFAQLSIEDQIGIAQGTDLFMGPHGAVFIHMLYLRLAPIAAVLEMQPPERRGGNFQFRNVCHMLRHRYTDQPIGSKIVSDRELESLKHKMSGLLTELWLARVHAVEDGESWTPPLTVTPIAPR
ncbi:hypothetical protein DFJ73DRAFT_948462 [Zopfochytrium polystomum]|nr:hypothetical protein DFJ73DRAFT_948462 [Zopfochytrium polystomum]